MKPATAAAPAHRLTSRHSQTWRTRCRLAAAGGAFPLAESLVGTGPFGRADAAAGARGASTTGSRFETAGTTSGRASELTGVATVGAGAAAAGVTGDDAGLVAESSER